MSGGDSLRDAISAGNSARHDRSDGPEAQSDASPMDGVVRRFIEHLRTTNEARTDLMRVASATLHDVFGATHRFTETSTCGLLVSLESAAQQQCAQPIAIPIPWLSVLTAISERQSRVMADQHSAVSCFAGAIGGPR